MSDTSSVTSSSYMDDYFPSRSSSPVSVADTVAVDVDAKSATSPTLRTIEATTPVAPALSPDTQASEGPVDTMEVLQQPKGAVPMSAADFARHVAKGSAPAAKVVWGGAAKAGGAAAAKAAPAPRPPRAAAEVEEAKKVLCRAKCAGEAAAPELELASGFAAVVYSGLLEAKKEVNKLTARGHRLAAAERRTQREEALMDKAYTTLLKAQGPLLRRKAKGHTRSTCEALLVSEEARKQAYHERLASMLADLKALVDTLKRSKAKRQYQHYSKLQDTVSTLDKEVGELRLRLQSQIHVETAGSNMKDVQHTLQVASENEVVAEACKKQARRCQDAVGVLQEDVSRGQQRLKVQEECRVRIAQKVAEAQQQVHEKKQSVPQMKDALQRKLATLAEQAAKLQVQQAKAQQDGGAEVERQRAQLMRRSSVAEKLRAEYEQSEAETQALLAEVEEIRAELHTQPTGCNEAAIEEKVSRESAGHVARLRAWTAERAALEEACQDEEAELARWTERIERADAEHAEKLRVVREAAEKRQAMLLAQLQQQQQAYAGGAEPTVAQEAVAAEGVAVSVSLPPEAPLSESPPISPLSTQPALPLATPQSLEMTPQTQPLSAVGPQVVDSPRSEEGSDAEAVFSLPATEADTPAKDADS